MRGKNEHKSLVDRFWEKFSRPKFGCWEWHGAKKSNRYGHIKRNSHDNGTIQVHRLAYMLFFGPIPEGLLVCHHCDNPSCVRPEHLFLGTDLDNVRDMIKKGRANYGRNKK